MIFLILSFFQNLKQAKTQKILLIFLSLIFFISESSLFSQNQDNTKIPVTIPDTSAHNGATIEIPIIVGDVTGLGVISFEFTLTYSDSILNAIGATVEGTIAQDWWGMPSAVFNTPGVAKIGAFTATHELNGSGPLVKIIFEVIGDPGDSTFLDFGFFQLNAGVPETETFCSIFYVTSESIVGSDNFPVSKTDFSLRQNYPNPFNSETVIEFSMLKAIPISINIYNQLGQKVKHFYNIYERPGFYQVLWNGKDEDGRKLETGIYFYQMVTHNLSETRRMILIK